MKKVLLIILGVIFAVQFAGVGCFADEIVKVKAGTVIPIALDNLQTSKNVTAGSKINAVIQQDVIVNGVKVFSKNDKAFLNVSHAKKAGFVGNPGEITITNGQVFDTAQNAHLIDFAQTYSGEEKTWSKVLLGCGLILLPLALFGFVKGGQAKIAPNITMPVRLIQDFDYTY